MVAGPILILKFREFNSQSAAEDPDASPCQILASIAFAALARVHSLIVVLYIGVALI